MAHSMGAALENQVLPSAGATLNTSKNNGCFSRPQKKKEKGRRGLFIYIRYKTHPVRTGNLIAPRTRGYVYHLASRWSYACWMPVDFNL